MSPENRPPEPIAIELDADHFLSHTDRDGNVVEVEPCLGCNGNHREPGDSCPVCDGAGVLEPVGLFFWHRSKQHNLGGWCGGQLWLRKSGRAKQWSTDQLSPLTLSPSILCSCGEHGFVRNGKWVAA